MLLGEVVCDGVWGISKRKSAGTADNDWFWLVHIKAISCEMFSDVFGTVVHVRHCSNNRRLRQQQHDEGKGVMSRLFL
jgi:hypothetical protein